MSTGPGNSSPGPVYDYFAGGAGDEQTIRDSELGWRQWWLVPDQMASSGTPDLGVELLGRRHAAPLLLAPAAAQRLLHPDGEIAAARAAAAAGLTYCLSTRATTDTRSRWPPRRPAATGGSSCTCSRTGTRPARCSARLAEHGYTHVVLTVDLPVAGRREREEWNGPIPFLPGVHVTSHLGRPILTETEPVPGGWAALRWDDLDWIAGVGLAGALQGCADRPGRATRGRARRGRWSSPPTAAGNSTGVCRRRGTSGRGRRGRRRGAGARRRRHPVRRRRGAGAGTGRGRGADGLPFLWGLAADGERGVAAALAALLDDIAGTLVLLGLDAVGQISREHLRARDW